MTPKVCPHKGRVPSRSSYQGGCVIRVLSGRRAAAAAHVTTPDVATLADGAGAPPAKQPRVRR